MKVSFEFMKEHLWLGTPLILTSLISGSAQYTDGVIISAVYRDPAMFAWFRYGAKEFPLVLMLANGLSNAMLPEFSTRERMRESLAKIRVKSKRLMHILFPIVMVVMLVHRWIYPRMFNPGFAEERRYFSYLFIVNSTQTSVSADHYCGKKEDPYQPDFGAA